MVKNNQPDFSYVPLVGLFLFMDWKKENPKSRYIDDIKWEEAKKVAFLAAGEPEDFELLSIEAKCNGNNIPHVKLHFRYYENLLGNAEENYIGIFHNLNIYYSSRFVITYCQKEVFKLLTELGFD